MNVSTVLCCAVALASSLAAQTGGQRVAVQEGIRSQQQKLDQAMAREQRLLELRIRHDLGLPVRVGRYLQLTDEDRDTAVIGGASLLEREQAEVQRLSAQLKQVEARVDSAQDAARQRLRQEEQSRAELSLVELGPTFGPTSRPMQPGPSAPRTEPAPAPEVEPAGKVHVIRGTDNHSVIGRALMRAGDHFQALAAGTTDPTKAKDLAARARKRYEQAREELILSAEREQPPVADLFYLARCEQKLGHLEAADSLYAQVMAVDHEETEGGRVYGPWGDAAETAKKVLRWLADSGQWKPAVDVGALDWSSTERRR